MQQVYIKVEPGQNVTGTIVQEFPAESSQECSIRWVECYLIASIKLVYICHNVLIVTSSDRGWDSGWCYLAIYFYG